MKWKSGITHRTNKKNCAFRISEMTYNKWQTRRSIQFWILNILFIFTENNNKLRFFGGHTTQKEQHIIYCILSVLRLLFCTQYVTQSSTMCVCVCVHNVYATIVDERWRFVGHKKEYRKYKGNLWFITLGTHSLCGQLPKIEHHFHRYVWMTEHKRKC